MRVCADAFEAGHFTDRHAAGGGGAAGVAGEFYSAHFVGNLGRRSLLVGAAISSCDLFDLIDFDFSIFHFFVARRLRLLF